MSESVSQSCLKSNREEKFTFQPISSCKDETTMIVQSERDSTHSDSEDYFIAAHLNHVQALRELLMANPQLINEQDHNGDQAIHIAARQDSFEVGRLLIEFDASIDTRNYEGLTPIGVARMNRNIHFVHLLNSHYISVRENSERVKFQRTGFSSICSQKVLRQEANKKRLEAQLERWKHLQKNIAAGCIQQQVRKLLVLRARERMFIKIECANLIQMKWRWRHRDEVYRQRQRSARIIQSFERMRIIKNNFINFHQEGLRLYRASRILACVAQRLWRGHLGRATLRRKIEVKNLPDPNDVKSFDSWLSIQKIANPPARTWGVYAEYYLSGYPRNWPERNTIKRHEIFYRDVRFYSHIVTRRVTWSQPETWKNFDKRTCNDQHFVKEKKN